MTWITYRTEHENDKTDQQDRRQLRHRGEFVLNKKRYKTQERINQAEINIKFLPMLEQVYIANCLYVFNVQMK